MLHEVSEGPACFDEFVVGSLFDDFSFGKDDDPVCCLYGRKTMRNEAGGVRARLAISLTVHLNSHIVVMSVRFCSAWMAAMTLISVSESSAVVPGSYTNVRH